MHFRILTHNESLENYEWITMIWLLLLLCFNLGTESVEHRSAEEHQSDTSTMSKHPGTAMIYVYNDITDEMLY